MSLFDRLGDFSARTAVVTDRGERVSYQQLADRADALVSELCRDGASEKPGLLVAVECDNSIDSLCAYVGAMRARLPVILIDAALQATSRQQLCDLYRVAACWNARAAIWQRTATSAEPVMPHPDLALLLSTSGSTGSPKLVRLSHRNLMENANSIATYLGLSAYERPITALPMHYSFGMSVVNSHLAVGATLLLTSQTIIARAFWDFFREQQGTSLSGVPAMYAMLERLALQDMDLPSLRTLTQAGGRLPADAVRRLAKLCESKGWRLFVMYGQTEASPRMAYLPPALAHDKAGSIGQAIPGGRLRLLDPAGETISRPRVEGELVYDGPNVMMGYAQSAPDLALGDMNLGTLKTGDLAWFDEDGFFTISGRIQRFLKIHGKRINLDDIESFVTGLGVSCAATGRDDLLLVAVRKPDSPPAAIAGEICSHFRLHHSVVRVIGVADFPRSGSGKILYPTLMDSMLSLPA